MTLPRHCHHNEGLSMGQDTAKVPNKCVAKLSICGFLGVALAANELSVRASIQALRFTCCWFFLETCGFVTSTVIHSAMLLYCLTLSGGEENCFWQQKTYIFLWYKNLQVGPSSSSLSSLADDEQALTSVCFFCFYSFTD